MFKEESNEKKVLLDIKGILGRKKCEKAGESIYCDLNHAALSNYPSTSRETVEKIGILRSLNMIEDSRQNLVKNYVYASTSSFFGDELKSITQIKEYYSKAFWIG